MKNDVFPTPLVRDSLKSASDCCLSAYTDMALDSAAPRTERRVIGGRDDLTKSEIVIRNLSEERQFGRKIGRYVTFSLSNSFYDDEKLLRQISRKIASAISQIGGKNKRNSVLVVGLGNPKVACDSLGSLTAEQVDVTALPSGRRIMTLTPSVEGVSGLSSLEVVKGVCDVVHPSLVIVIDSLCTSKTERLCSCVQLSSAGLSPGSGVGAHRQGIDSAALGVSVLAVGVPMAIRLKTLVSDTVAELSAKRNGIEPNTMQSNAAISAFLGENPVVAPKEVDYSVKKYARLLGEAINFALK